MQGQQETFDAIVVGSGISGGWAAKELTERGLRVLLLERGKNVEHGKDYTSARKAPWDYPHRGGRTRELVDAYPVLKRDYPLNEKNLDWWAERAGVALHRGQALRLVPRLPGRRPVADLGPPELSPQRFRFRGQRQGRHRRRLADPLRRHRAVVRPRRTPRRHLRIDRGAAAAARRPVPAGDAAQLRRAGDRRPAVEAVRRHAADHPRPRRQPDAAARQARALPVSQRLPPRLSLRRLLQHAVLDAAGGGGHRPADAEGPRHRHRRGLRPRSQARHRRARDRRRTRTRPRSTRRRSCSSARPRSTRTWILMRSATDVWPGGLGSSSGELGHNLMDHHFRCGANGVVDEFEDRNVYGRRPTGFYIPRFRNLGDKRAYLRGFGYQGSANRQGWERAVAELGVGARSRTRWPRRGRGASAPRRSARCCRTTPTASRSTRRRPTSGACRCWRSTAPPARTSG